MCGNVASLTTPGLSGFTRINDVDICESHRFARRNKFHPCQHTWSAAVEGAPVAKFRTVKNCVWKGAQLFERLIPETGTEMKQ